MEYLPIVRQGHIDVTESSENPLRAKYAIQRLIVLQSVQERQNKGPSWKPSCQFIDHSSEIVGLARKDRHVRIWIDTVEQMKLRPGPAIAERTAYPQAIPFDLAGSVRIMTELNEAAIEVASDQINPIFLDILQ
jgi:hypothetical protein